MVQILLAYLKKIHQLISYLCLSRKKIWYLFQRFKGEKSHESRNLDTDTKRHFWVFLIEINVDFIYFYLKIAKIAVRRQ
jgi:hypothetical protein